MSSRNWNHKRSRNYGAQSSIVDRFRSHAKNGFISMREFISKHTHTHTYTQFYWVWSDLSRVEFGLRFGVNETHREHGNQNIAFINWLIKSLSHKIDLSNRMLFCTYTHTHTAVVRQNRKPIVMEWIGPIFWSEQETTGIGASETTSRASAFMKKRGGHHML